MVKVVLELGAMGTLSPSLAMVKVWETPVAGSMLETWVAAVSALGFDGSIVWTLSGPMVPVATAYLSAPLGRAVALSKFTTVMTTSLFAGRVKAEGMYPGLSPPPSIAGVSMLSVTWTGTFGAGAWFAAEALIEGAGAW